jgi:two-component system, LytTR family, response regulator
MMTVLIVDDEHLARRGVRVCLKNEADVAILGECSSGKQAVERIRALNPDIVFLDVEMPGMSGFDVLAQLDRETRPLIVFLTAPDQYALPAFDSHAADYVLKPIDDARFKDTLERMRRRIREKVADTALNGTLPDNPKSAEVATNRAGTRLAKFAVRIGSRVKILPVESVSWIGAAGDYVTLHVGARQLLIRESLQNLEGQLDPAKFARVHRSAIVALDHVLEIAALPSRDYELILKDGTRLRGSRRYKERMSTALKISPK